MTSSAKRIRIGKIATAHGVRGLVKILVLADDPELLSHNPLFTAETGDATIEITPKNSMGKYWLAAIDNISERNAAEALRHTELWIDKDVLPQAAAGEFYISDLVGVTALDANNVTIGTIIAVADFGASPLLEIKPEGKPSFYVPFTHETVPDDDVMDGAIRIILPENLPR